MATNQAPTLLICIPRKEDGQYPVTLSNEQILLTDDQYFYTWVQIEEGPEYDTEKFCVYVNGYFHEAQSIDFDFPGTSGIG